jgi:hypothetical protein
MPKKANNAAAAGRTRAAGTENSQATVATLAYELWLGRGCPIGSPEIDWFRAEEVLKSQTEATAGMALEETARSMAATSGD